MTDIVVFDRAKTENPIPYDTFDAMIRDSFPDGKWAFHENGEVLIHTGLKVVAIEGDIFIEPINHGVPENVVQISTHPKFLIYVNEDD
jgi:hypothetical protein